MLIPAQAPTPQFWQFCGLVGNDQEGLTCFSVTVKCSWNSYIPPWGVIMHTSVEHSSLWRSLTNEPSSHSLCSSCMGCYICTQRTIRWSLNVTSKFAINISRVLVTRHAVMKCQWHTYGFIHFRLQDHRESQEGLDKVVSEETCIACVSLCNALADSWRIL